MKIFMVTFFTKQHRWVIDFSWKNIVYTTWRDLSLYVAILSQWARIDQHVHCSLLWMCTLFCFMESLFPKILLQCLRQMMAHASKVWGVRTLKPSHYVRTPVSLYQQHLDLPFSWPTTVIVIIPTTYDLVCKPTPPVTCPDQTLWSPRDGWFVVPDERKFTISLGLVPGLWIILQYWERYC